MPMLKTSYISLSSTLRVPLDEGEDRVRLDQPVDLESHVRLDPRQVEEAVAGDVDERLDAFDALQNFHGLGNVDVGRAQQLLAERGSELVEFVIDGVAIVGKEGLARQRQAVAVHAVALHADDHVAFGDMSCRK